MSPHRGSTFDQHLHDLDGWRITQVVGAFLERQAPDGNLPAVESTQQLVGSSHEPALGLTIDFQNGAQQTRMQSGAFGHAGQRPHVLGKAGTAETNSCMEKTWPNPFVGPDPRGDHRHVGAESLTETGDVIDKRDLGRQECVCRVLDELRRTVIGPQDGGAKRFVERADLRQRIRIVTAKHDAIGMQDVVQHPPFAQELGIADDGVNRVLRRVLGHDAGDELGGTDRHRALVDDDGRGCRSQVRTDRRRGGPYLTKIRLAVGK